jgi:hypothetical protein
MGKCAAEYIIKAGAPRRIILAFSSSQEALLVLAAHFF